MKISQSQSASPGRQCITTLFDVAPKKEVFPDCCLQAGGTVLMRQAEVPHPIPIYFYPKSKCFGIALRQRFHGNTL
jgi:hypothetical protein